MKLKATCSGKFWSPIYVGLTDRIQNAGSIILSLSCGTLELRSAISANCSLLVFESSALELLTKYHFDHEQHSPQSKLLPCYH